MKGSSCPFTLNELMKHHLPSRPSEVLPDSSAGKESACNAGDPSSIPGSGRSPGEEISYPFQYSWASLVAQLVKNLPAMWETWFDLWVGKISYRREQLPTPVFVGFPGGSAGKESTCNAGDPGSIPGLQRFPGEGNGYPLQYSGLENSMDSVVHGVAKSWTCPSGFHFTEDQNWVEQGNFAHGLANK